jgi:hypothetical protein
MYRTLGPRLGIRLGLLESTTHCWISLHLLGPTAIIGSGPASWGCMINVGQPGMERVEGSDFCWPSQDGMGLRCGRYEKLTLHSHSLKPVGILCRFIPTLYKGSVNDKSRVVYDEIPNPCYNEYICYNATSANATSFESTSYVASIQIEARRVNLSGPVNRFGLKIYL